jgi:RNA recognition motif-containing protein
MVALPLELPSDVVVFKTFVSLRSDFARDSVRRSQSCPPEMCFELEGADSAAVEPLPRITSSGPTTLLLHNLPLRGRILSVLGHLDALGLEGTYDYVYAPVDTRTHMLKGYAFVNFTGPADAQRCLRRIEGTRLKGSSSKRTITACAAARQGLDANLATLSSCSKKNRRKDAELPWLRVAGEMQPIQETERALVLK